MDDRVRQAALGALRRLGTPPAPADPGRDPLRLENLSLAQLSNLAYFLAGDPLVAQVAEALRGGRPVYLDRPDLERQLGLAHYPPRMQEQFARWFSRISGYGVHLDSGPAALVSAPGPSEEGSGAATPAAPGPAAAAAPEREILADILGEACSGGTPCVLEPGKGCCGSGRCKSLGF